MQAQVKVGQGGVNARKQRSWGSQFKMEGGRSEMEIQRAVYLHHGNQLDCQSHATTVCSAHSPLLHYTKRRGVQHLLRCIVGPVVVQTKRGRGVCVWGGS